MSNVIKLSSVKLVDGGIKGIVADYITHQTVDGRLYVNEHSDKRKAPVHKELKENFDKLRFYLLDICGYEVGNQDFIDDDGNIVSVPFCSEVQVTGVKAGEDYFIITGKREVTDNGKVVSLTTPKITMDDYHNYSKVVAVIDALYVEADLFINGERSMDDKQLVMDFYSKKTKTDDDRAAFDEMFMGMTNEEMKEKATEILEGFGSIVMHNDEIDVNSMEPAFVNPVVDEQPTATIQDIEDTMELLAQPAEVIHHERTQEISSEVDMDSVPSFDAIADQVVVEHKEEAVLLPEAEMNMVPDFNAMYPTNEEGVFILPVAAPKEVKQSTAKRIDE